MFRKNYFIFVLMVAAILIGNTAVFAQDSATISGRVQMTDDKGAKTPMPNLLVEAYRTDTAKVEPVSAKTDEKGDFKIENLPSGKTFALAVSGQRIEASVVTDVKSGATDVAVAVKSGNGSQPSADAVRQSLLAAGKLQVSAEEKAETEKALKAIEERNSKSEQTNVVTKRAVEEGNKAFNDKNYDVAIGKFEEGYQADTKFLGSAPTFLNNKGIALKMRGLEYHNKNVTSGENKEAKIENYNKAVKDFGDGIDTYYASWNLLKNATDAEKSSTQGFQENKMRTLSGARDLLDIAVKTEKADPEKIDKAKELIEAYVNFETDKAKKYEAQAILANYYRFAGNFDSAIAEFRKILAVSPKEPGALFGLGISLISTGYNDDGSIKKPVIQEGVNLLQRFKDVASDEKFKRDLADATSTLNDQKVANNITPKN